MCSSDLSTVAALAQAGSGAPQMRGDGPAPQARPFSITLVFPELDGPAFAAALQRARGAAEFREMGEGESRRYRVRFHSSDVERLRDVFQVVGPAHTTEVLIDDRPVPYARELWLPLVWFLLPR